MQSAPGGAAVNTGSDDASTGLLLIMAPRKSYYQSHHSADSYDVSPKPRHESDELA